MGNKKSDKKQKDSAGAFTGHVGAIKLARGSFEFQLSGKKSRDSRFAIDAKDIAFFIATVAIITAAQARNQKISVEARDDENGFKILNAVSVGRIAPPKKKSNAETKDTDKSPSVQLVS
jgi:hypothetical protein